MIEKRRHDNFDRTDRQMSDRLDQDFERIAYSLFGLPVDHCSQDDLVSRLLNSPERGPTVIVTPNLQIARESCRDPQFKEDLLQADLLLADGMPLVWAARILALPIRERTTGSGSIQKLLQVAPPNSLQLKLFGGTQGTCHQAVQRISEFSQAQVVQWLEPPVGSVEELSDPALLEKISSPASDLLLTSLTAKKALAWLHRHKGQLQSRFFMEFGAGLKFIAGRVTRAPAWMQRSGLEWVWRTVQEPELFGRYARDASFFLTHLVTKIAPLALWVRLVGKFSSASGQVDSHSDTNTIYLRGCFSDQSELEPLVEALKEAARQPQDTLINLNRVEYLGCRAVALFWLCRKHKQARHTRLRFQAETWRPRLLLKLHQAWLLTL